MTRAASHGLGHTAPQVARRARVPPKTVAAQEEPLAQDEIELAVVDLAVVESEREDDHVDQVANLLDLGPLIALGQVLDEERVEVEDLRDLGQ